MLQRDDKAARRVACIEYTVSCVKYVASKKTMLLGVRLRSAQEKGGSQLFSSRVPPFELSFFFVLGLQGKGACVMCTRMKIIRDR